MKNLHQKKILSATGTMLMTLGICQSIAVQASDIEIYSNATGGKTTITMMLDTSGSMSVQQVGANACDLPVGATYRTWSNETSNTTPIYARGYCEVQGSQTRYYDRLTRLKDAIFTLMDSNQIDSDSVAIGLGQFSSQRQNIVGYDSADGVSGRIVVPAAALNANQRMALKTAVANFQGWNGTPTANAYAEVAAYMLGESTTTGQSFQGYFIRNSDSRYVRCRRWNGTACVAWTAWTNGPVAIPSGYTPGSTGIVGGQSGRFYLGEKTDRGFAQSAASTKNGTRYRSPLSTTNSQCDGRGIYFFTDGEPNSSFDPVSVMQRALGSAGNTFSVPATGTLPDGTQAGHGMPAVGEFARALRNQKTSASAPNRNPLGLEIKTAVVGFGSVFNIDRTADAAKPVNQRIIRSLDYINSRGERTNEKRDYYNCSLIENVDARNACNWGGKSHPDLPTNVGGYGEGGFYSAQSTNDVIQSVIKFLDEVKPEFDPVATGSPTIPKDALNPLRIQPFGYYASFVPKPQESTQLWVGNINKYQIYNGELYDNSKTKKLILSSGALNKDVNGMWTNGMKGQIPLGLGQTSSNQQFAQRKIFTNRKINTTAPYVAHDSNSLNKVNVDTLFGSGATALFANDPDKNYWLNLLGYNISASATGVTLANLPMNPELRQVGAVMHSTPILLTQKGKITYTSGVIDTTDRDDYLLFGSSQGLLHIVDARSGIEKFAFAPNEMMQNQKEAFLSEVSSTGGKNNLFYGVDAPWVTHTQYTTKTDGTLTVNTSDRTSNGSTDQNFALKGMQWVYGGLRMGGKSYYALDLSDLDYPRLKFHIDPTNAKIYKSNVNTPVNVPALAYMGQSWSKPTLAYVKFGGIKKFVMFVGGGYDIGFENSDYKQNSTLGSGAGVYMFDANTGDLLWWSSANATEARGAEAYTDASASSVNMKYSVVSQINAIDRDNDGLVDHLYFGDLYGQAFRIDLNNLATTKANFATRAVRLFQHIDQNDKSVPRFYEMPSFSVHRDEQSGLIGAVALSSGNRSSPLSGSLGGNQAGSTDSAADGVFVVYDKDVANAALYHPTYALTTQNINFTDLNSNIATGVAVTGSQGWKYTYSTISGVYKGMNELYALDNMLYVNVFHRDGLGIGGSCGSGVKGDSYIYQFCLPTGKCPFSTTSLNTPNRVKVGAGIMGSGLGQAPDNSANQVGLIVSRNQTTDCTKSPNAPECQKFNIIPKSQPLRWYEIR